MKIKKGTRLKITHRRKGIFIGTAERDFDTDTEEFYPVKVAQGVVHGMREDWGAGERIPCRGTLCEVTVID